MSQTILSQKEFEDFSNELKYRKEMLREEIKEELIFAEDLGDDRENFPYDAAIDRQRVNEARIVDLEYILKHSNLRRGFQSESPVIVDLNHTVEIEKENGEKKTVKIVTKDHFEITKALGLITLDSPLGKILMGKKIGEIFELILPNQKVVYKILNILN